MSNLFLYRAVCLFSPQNITVLLDYRERVVLDQGLIFNLIGASGCHIHTVAYNLALL